MTLFNLQNQIAVRVLALVTMLVMVASLVPASVFAEDVTPVAPTVDESTIDQPVVDPVPDPTVPPADEEPSLFESAKTMVGEVMALMIPPCSPQTSVTGPTDIQNTNTSDYFNSVNDALADCDTQDGDTIALLADISIGQQITIARPITLDGNGFTISPTFIRVNNSNNSSIGIIDTQDVLIKDVTVDGSAGTDLHGINVYQSTNVDIADVTIQNPKRTGVVVNGSEVMVSNLTTSGSTWHAINANPGSGVTAPTILTVNGVSVHGETAPTPHIYLDDTSKNVTINDTNNQYEVVYEGPNPQNTNVTARSLRLKNTIKVHIYKYLQEEEAITQVPNNSTAPSFPMVSTWSAENIGSGSGRYVLGNNEGGTVLRYAADTSPMSKPADYTTSEVTGGDSPVLPNDAKCEEGKYRLLGYKEGNSIALAEAADMSLTAPIYTDITNDKYTIVVNEKCGDDPDPEPVCTIGKNLLANGSFEDTPVVTDNGGQWQIFATISHWITGLSDGIEVWNTFNGVSDDVASDGLQNVELDGNNATRITQAATTIPGATYELKFDFSARATIGAADNVMAVLIDGATVDTVNGDGIGTTTNVWTPQSQTFVAASTSTIIGFEDIGTANEDGGFGPLLDNVALCLVKEPEPLPTCSLTIKSDVNDYVVEKNAMAKLMSYIHPSWVTSIGTSSAAWIWGDNPVVNPLINETQTFKKGFNWTGGTVTGATLTLASDNSHAFTLGSSTGGNPGEFNYGAVTSYNVASGITAGANTLEIAVENFAQTNGTPTSNPAGLMYELTITGTGKSCGEVVPEVPKTSGDVTMCKVDGNDDPLAGWTMTLLKDTPVDSVVVPAGNAAGVNTTAILNAGKSYVAVAQGTWTNDRTPSPINLVDAEYSTEDAWSTHMDGFGTDAKILELLIDGNDDPNSNWGTYNGAHTYAQMFTQAVTGSVKFNVYDTFYGDNSGSLNVKVFEGYAGITGKNGCVTFKDVPFGTYTADEVLQAGWEQVSGAGATTVTYANTPKTITIANEEEDEDNEPQTYTITGFKWNDVDGDGIKDAEEGKLAGWVIQAVNGTTTIATTTDVNGNYTLVVPSGTWVVSETAQSGWTQTGLYQNGDKVTLGGEVANTCTFNFSDINEVPSEILGAMCDFGNKQNAVVIIDPETPAPTNRGGGGGSGTRITNRVAPTGLVLGAASSTPACGIYLNDYMRLGNAASSTQVTKLQVFLNAVGITAPLTGIFDAATDAAVREFQMKHKAEVLTPWYMAKLVPHENPTGWVYQLTRWKINNIVCPGSEAYPVLN